MNIKQFSSRKELSQFLLNKGIDTSEWTEEKWLSINKGQAEIHMMALAEAVWDAKNESKPKYLSAGQWHIPFDNKIEDLPVMELLGMKDDLSISIADLDFARVKIAVAMCARTSYTTIGEEKEINYKNLIDIHDRMINAKPIHFSPFEHCARVMSEDEYHTSIKGKCDFYDITMNTKMLLPEEGNEGWSDNLKGFIPYRHMIQYPEDYNG